MERLNAEADHTLRRIKAFSVREELNMGDEPGDSGTLPTTVPDLLQRALQKFGQLRNCTYTVLHSHCILAAYKYIWLVIDRERGIASGIHWCLGL